MKKEILSLLNEVGQNVSIEGWIYNIRDHKNMIFVDIKDRSGILQLFVSGKDLIAVVKTLNTGDLIRASGLVQNRPSKLVNPKIDTGKIEVQVTSIEIVSKSAGLPFELDGDTKKINEQTRLKYRYLDLRTDRMQKNLKARHEINIFLRNYFSEKGFWEIETPCLTKGTPEGAREFIIPSRLHPGSFYVLPQSPQQFKQLLMVGGIERYFQIAKCFRDEDQRIDRQPEFTQFDLEMSFVDEEDIRRLIEEAIIQLVKKIFPRLKIQKIPFPILTYKESMEKYNSDKPDLRKNKKENDILSFCWVVDFPLFELSNSKGKISSCHHPFTRPKDEDVGLLSSEPLKARAKAYDLVLNGYEIGGGSIRISDSALQKKIFEILGLNREEIDMRFGHMLNAFKFAPPPHGGIALGLDRLYSLLLEEDSIREVIAFPKTGDAKDLLMGAPSGVSQQALKEAHIKPINQSS